MTAMPYETLRSDVDVRGRKKAKMTHGKLHAVKTDAIYIEETDTVRMAVAF